MKSSSKIALAALLLACAAAGTLVWARRSRGVVLLEPDGPARWIRPAEPFRLEGRGPGPREALFRKRFTLAAPASPVLSLRALKLAKVWVDGAEIYSDRDPGDWKTPREVELGALSQGPHELKVAVLDLDGPDALLARAELPGLSTDAAWESTRDERAWAPAVPVDEPARAGLSELFDGPGRALARAAPFLAPLFALVFVGSSAFGWTLRARQVRYLALAAWTAVGAAAMARLPLDVGYDVVGHVEYMRLILARLALPGPADGWQTFQGPLFYFLSLPFYAVARRLGTPLAAQILLRVVPWLCGAAQIELCYRAGRILFPQREDLQSCACVLGGLMPMNLYLSLYVGNESLAGALVAATIVAALKTAGGRALKGYWLVGGLLGLALLAKASALLLAAPLTAFLFASAPGRARARLKYAAAPLGTALLISGWFYARAWLLTGALLPLSSYGRVGLAGEAAVSWWQDPGYRTLAQVFSFGAALRRPVYAAVAGFWDALYSTAWFDGLLSSMTTFSRRPPWDYRFLLTLPWLSVPPAVCIAAGFLRALFGKSRRALVFLAGCVAVYLAAVFALWARLPIYSVAKATYTIGLLPCYAALACFALEALPRRPALEAARAAWLTCWAAAGVLAFFAR